MRAGVSFRFLDGLGISDATIVEEDAIGEEVMAEGEDGCMLSPFRWMARVFCVWVSTMVIIAAVARC